MKSIKSLRVVLILAIYAVMAVHSLGADGKCRALALRGGGTKGAYEVGVLEGLIQNLPPEDVQYDVVVGVSIGAITASLISVYPKGEEAAAVAELKELWKTNQAQDLWQMWPDVNIAGIFLKNAVLDSSPIKKMVASLLDGRPFQRKVSFQSVDINQGTVYIFDETVPDEYRIEAVMGSASIPGFFSPQYIEDLVLVDGGTYENLNLAEAIVKCREEGAADEDIIIDVILCFPGPQNPTKWTYQQAKWKTAWDFYQRRKELTNIYYYKEDVSRVVRMFPNINFRYIISPSQIIPEQFVPIFSTSEEIQYQLDLGLKDANNLFKNNTTTNSTINIPDFQN